ncbi:hypothetical protein BASA62_007724 [Batrachochytrium salamandrivorans]|nr:hypothetical protein BASA62_007724 [Batrachochytrium salamandrivorans]
MRFVESEAIYFKSTYSHEKILGEGKFGTVYLGTKRSNGMRVACKTIPTENVEEYALELSPPPRCHTPNPLSRHKKLAAAQCMSPRPSGLYVPHEVAIHMYLSRPGNENIYVPRAIDYITLQDGFILIMEYINEEWVSLLSYLMERGRLGVSEARHIIRKVIDGMINLKQQGVLQEDLHAHPFAHFVVECEQVTGHRIQSGLVPAIQKSRLRLLGRALDPGVENVYTWLRGGVINGEADLDQLLVGRGLWSMNLWGKRHDNRALAARLADFLQVAYRQYQSTLWKYHRDRLVEVG